LRGIHYVEYSKAALEEIAKTVITLANAEDLPGHAAAVEVRMP
jgi:histidinol dehydrogenase